MLLTADDARRITDRLLGMVKADDAAVGVVSQMNSNLRFAANTPADERPDRHGHRPRDRLDRSAPRRLVDDRPERRVAAADGRAGAGPRAPVAGRPRVHADARAAEVRADAAVCRGNRDLVAGRSREGRRRGARGVREGEGRQRRLSPGPGDGRRGSDEERQFQLRAQHDRQPRHDRPHARRRGIGVLPAQPHRRPPRRHAARLPRGHPAGAGVARRAARSKPAAIP